MECIIQFIIKTFPEIQIQPSGLGTEYFPDSDEEADGDDDSDGDSDNNMSDDDDDDDDDSDSDDEKSEVTYYGMHDRDEFPAVINLNGGMFDCIEEFHRKGIPYAHLLYFVVIVVTHEMGHYLNSCVRNSVYCFLQQGLTNRM